MFKKQTFLKNIFNYSMKISLIGEKTFIKFSYKLWTLKNFITL